MSDSKTPKPSKQTKSAKAKGPGLFYRWILRPLLFVLGILLVVVAAFTWNIFGFRDRVAVYAINAADESIRGSFKYDSLSTADYPILRATGFQVLDPDGVQVLRIEELDLRFNLMRFVFENTLALEEGDAHGASASFSPASDRGLRIERAFEGMSKARSEGKNMRILLPKVSLHEVSADFRLPNAPPFQLSAEGLMTVDVSNFGVPVLSFEQVHGSAQITGVPLRPTISNAEGHISGGGQERLRFQIRGEVLGHPLGLTITGTAAEEGMNISMRTDTRQSGLIGALINLGMDITQ